MAIDVEGFYLGDYYNLNIAEGDGCCKVLDLLSYDDKGKAINYSSVQWKWDIFQSVASLGGDSVTVPSSVKHILDDILPELNKNNLTLGTKEMAEFFRLWFIDFDTIIIQTNPQKPSSVVAYSPRYRTVTRSMHWYGAACVLALFSMIGSIAYISTCGENNKEIRIRLTGHNS